MFCIFCQDQFRVFPKLEIFQFFPAPIECKVLKQTPFMRRRGSGCVPFRAQSPTAAKRTGLRRKHSEVFQNSIFGLLFCKTRIHLFYKGFCNRNKSFAGVLLRIIENRIKKFPKYKSYFFAFWNT